MQASLFTTEMFGNGDCCWDGFCDEELSLLGLGLRQGNLLNREH